MGAACAVYPRAIGTFVFANSDFWSAARRVQMRIGLIVPEQVRPTVSLSLFDMVQLLGLQLVAQGIDTVIHAP